MSKTLRKGSAWESVVLNRNQQGDSFLTEKNDATITALASHYGAKVSTERCVAVHGSLTSPAASSILKVTIL